MSKTGHVQDRDFTQHERKVNGPRAVAFSWNRWSCWTTFLEFYHSSRLENCTFLEDLNPLMRMRRGPWQESGPSVKLKLSTTKTPS